MRRDDDDELLPAHRLERALPPPDRARADREIGDALLDGVLEQVAVPELVQPDRDVRVELVPHADVAWQHADGHRQHRGDLELSQLDGERRAGSLPTPLERPDGDARLG